MRRSRVSRRRRTRICGTISRCRRKTMASRATAWCLLACSGAWLGACGGEAFSVNSDGGSGSASGTSASGGLSGASAGSQSGASGSSAAGASGGSTSSGSQSTGSSTTGSSTTGSSASGSSTTGSSATGSSGGSSGTGSSGGDAATAVSCPIIAPNAGSVCPRPALQCEYGSNPDIRCDQLAICSSAGAWSYAAASKCPVAMCPATYDDIPAGGHCILANETCAYAKGTCICAQSMGGPVRLPDAGITTSWSCFPSTLPCRSPRPNVGSACTDDKRICDYGVCSGGVELACTEGLWQEDFVACATAN